jgi:hypothetical protein
VQPEWIAGNVLKIQDPAGDVALQASGYRLAEIDGALATMSNPIDWLAGKGFGFSFEAPGFVGAEGEDEAHRNLHFTPLSILVYYGLAFAVPFYWLLVTCTVRSVRMIRGGSAPAVVGAFFIGHLAFSFTEFSVFVYATFAVSCGLVLAMSREHDHGRRKSLLRLCLRQVRVYGESNRQFDERHRRLRSLIPGGHVHDHGRR